MAGLSPMNDAATRAVIRARLREKVAREKLQFQLLDNNDDFAETIRIKLQDLLDSTQFWNFSRCGKEDIYRTCRGCSAVQTFSYRCNLKWCPRCQQRLGLIRRNLIRLWAKRITQPKHLVLTQRNFPTLTRKKIRTLTKHLARLRRAKCFRQVKGGCASIEVTNEGAGWHLHAHLLLDVRWLDMAEISKKWGRLVEQEFAIVKIKDVREADYLQEICKYVVEGSELAKWQPDQINEFVQAVRGLRMFNSFGSLRELAPQIRREIFAQKPPSPVCACGCAEFIYEDEESTLLNEVRQLERHPHKERSFRHVLGVEQPAAAVAAGIPALL